MANDGSDGRLIFLTGGTGFVGLSVARRLVERGIRLRALVRDRKSRGAAELHELGADLVLGDITQEQTLSGALRNCDGIVHLVGIIKEKRPRVTFEAVHTRGTLHLVDAAKHAGVEVFVYMSALGARPDGTAYQRTKYEAEEAVRRSGLSYVIFRPSLIIGRDGEFTRMLLRMVRLLPVIPVIGDGQYRLQPVFVADVADACATALERDSTWNHAYELVGPHKLTYNRILEIVCEELGFRRSKFHVPLRFVRPIVEVASNWRLPAPINSDQLAMLLEESVVHGESNDLLDVFGVQPKPLRAVIRELRT